MEGGVSRALDGKVAWVTGGSGSMGSAITEALARVGTVVLTTDLAEKGEPGSGGAAYRRCDVTRSDDIDSTVRYCLDEFGRLDILVNNAGIQRRIDIFDVSPELWANMLNVNLTSYFFCSQAAARGMIETGHGGSIVNIVSISSDYVEEDTIPYCVSKGGVKTLTLALAVALGRYAVRVNGISPGTIRTNMNRHRLDAPNAAKAIAAATPLGRVGTPEDVASAVVYLSSDAASFVTGAILPVHGGRVLRPFGRLEPAPPG